MKLTLFTVLACWLCARPVALAQASSSPSLTAPEPSPWKEGVGEGFRQWSHSVGVSLGGGFGMAVLGSEQKHDWALAMVHYSWMLTDVLAPNRFYRGNVELVAEVFGAGQFHPEAGYVIGTAPLFRYSFATGSRWVPFFDLGAGVAATDIRSGDLSTTFEFNLQTGLGVKYFLRDNMALGLQYRFIHISDANIGSPNKGVNVSNILLGVSWYF